MTVEQAIALHRAGRIDAAAQAYQAVLARSPRHQQALLHYGVLRLQQGDAAGAEALLRQAIAADPQTPEAHANLATALQAQGRHVEAVDAFRAALAQRLDLTDAAFGLAACLQACGCEAEAIAAWQALLDREPAHPEANFSLATLLLQAGRTEDAAARLRAAIAADPDFAEAHLALGTLLVVVVGGLDEAVRHFRCALDVDPDYLEAQLALAGALSRLHRDDEAVSSFRQVLAVDPGHTAAHLGLATVLDRQRLHAAAIEHYRAVLARQPDHPDAMAGLATALKNSGQHAAALPLARRVAAMQPGSAASGALVGAILAETGAIEAAQEQFSRALATAPDRPEYAYYLVELAKVRAGDAVLAALEAMLARIDGYTATEQCYVYFALAKACDDIGARDRAFSLLLRGNTLKRSFVDYREAATLATLARTAQVFTPELLAARAGVGDPSPVPVFVVGMPRSGTTLVEQILASHRAMFGAGERTDLSRVLSQLRTAPGGSAPFPEAFWTLPAATLRRLGAEYVAALRGVGGGAERIVDKLPANFLFAGVIPLILPKARIVHVRRDPVDTCLSCFSKLFAGEQPFSYELGELGRYYRGYERLMAHWRRVLPPSVMLEVVYEDLVADVETEARRLVAHCGLPWDDACLAFHAAERAVHTASLVQVRQPIYRSSVGRWRPPPALLQPLLDGLAGNADPSASLPDAPPPSG